MTVDTEVAGDEPAEKYSVPRAGWWIVAYVVLALVPIGVAVLGPLPPPRPFLVELGVGLGFLGIAILALQFVTSGRFRRVAPLFGADVVLQFHRQAGIVAFALILAHPAVLILSDPDYLEYFDPRVNLLRALALTTVVPAAVLLLVTSFWRERVGLSYEWWRVAHGALSLFVVFVGLVHGLQVGHYLDGWWRRGLWVGFVGGALYLVIHSRVVRPLRMRRRPYRVASVVAETDEVNSLTLEPVDHPGLRFRAGQYVWVTIGPSAFSLQQHPFSVASSERERTLTVTAKELGDFTSTWPDIAPGSAAWVEGPYGGFTLDADAPGAVFIVGGIGVTPAMSILRTMRDTGDRRPAILVYGTDSCDGVVFADEIAALPDELDLRIVHVPEDPPDGWEGHAGFIDRDLLAAELDDAALGYEFFICGPDPMMDAAESALRDLGVSWRRVLSERFQIV